jgi:Protein of unknown function (DUF3037)
MKPFMQEKHLFEYAVIRIVPRVEREEFLNVGVVLYCKRPIFLNSKISLNVNRLLSLFPDIDTEEITSHLQAFERIIAGDSDAGPIASLDTASRFRWLTAKRSTILQTSLVHPGICKDPDVTLNNLYQQLVSC